MYRYIENGIVSNYLNCNLFFWTTNHFHDNLHCRTGLIYDERMLQHRNLWDPRYPENPERIRSPYKRCLDYGLVERCVRLEVSGDNNGVMEISKSLSKFLTLICTHITNLKIEFELLSLVLKVQSWHNNEITQVLQMKYIVWCKWLSIVCTFCHKMNLLLSSCFNVLSYSYYFLQFLVNYVF